jgi:hypothetical protein
LIILTMLMPDGHTDQAPPAAGTQGPAITFGIELQFVQEAVAESLQGSSFPGIMPSGRQAVFPVYTGIITAETVAFIPPGFCLYVETVTGRAGVGAYAAGLAGLGIFFHMGCSNIPLSFCATPSYFTFRLKEICLAIRLPFLPAYQLSYQWPPVPFGNSVPHITLLAHIADDDIGMSGSVGFTPMEAQKQLPPGV